MNLILIGQRASGKSSAGRQLAAAERVPFLDTDDEVERRLGRPAAELFAAGEEALFRDTESRVAAHLARMEGTVIAAGGGLPVADGNAARLRSAGHVVWLDCTPAVLLERRRAQEDACARPALTDLPLEEEILRIHEERRPFYRAAANTVIDTSRLPLPEVVGELAELWRAITLSK